MLAHDLVPHHHHDDVDAIEQSQTHSSNAEKEHNHDFPEHEHQQDDYLFVVRQALILSPNRGRLIDDDCIGNYGFDYFFIHTSNILITYSPPDYKIPIWERHQNIPTIVTYTFGLRAPPAII
ncbi:MAG: hypothetical protein KGZ71_03730 [Desulfobulbaceae bacterium]|nr:hypothetical protein [Desulfobulbaceae bacterium]